MCWEDVLPLSYPGRFGNPGISSAIVVFLQHCVNLQEKEIVMMTTNLQCNCCHCVSLQIKGDRIDDNQPYAQIESTSLKVPSLHTERTESYLR